MNETKTERNLLVVFYWPISKIKYFGRMKIKSQFYIFSFPAWTEAELMNAFKWWAISMIF